MRIAIVTTSCLEQFGHEILLATPSQFRSEPCPTYPEIRLALFPCDGVSAAMRALELDPQDCRERALRSGSEMCSRDSNRTWSPAHGHRPTCALPVHPALRQPV